jgi:hypothetical protein
MRRTYLTTPGVYTRCACEGAQTGHCSQGRHRACGRSTPLRAVETYICTPDGLVTNLPKLFRHATDTSATGPSRTSAAQVWLADRVCRWTCTCTCHTGPLPPGSAPIQMSLFDTEEILR